MNYLIGFFVLLFCIGCIFLEGLVVLGMLQYLYKIIVGENFASFMLFLLIFGSIAFFFYCVFFDPSILSTDLPLQREFVR